MYRSRDTFRVVELRSSRLAGEVAWTREIIGLHKLGSLVQNNYFEARKSQGMAG
jgi:hypothetical protein